jgi:AraC-like DNA-binding protein
MLRNSHRLLTLINQLLDLSRFDSGKLKLQGTCRDIVSFLKSIIGTFQVLAQETPDPDEGEEGEESIVRGLETGADDYVAKPFNSRILLSRIKNLIELRRQMQLKIQRRKMLLPSEISVSSMDETFLKEFQHIVEKNLSDEEFDVDKLCGKLYMGRSTLFKKVKALTGETPNQFIMSYRLERGAQLLRENFGNVTEVAFAVGFSSSTYFAACFKGRFGQAPSSYQAAGAK